MRYYSNMQSIDRRTFLFFPVAFCLFPSIRHTTVRIFPLFRSLRFTLSSRVHGMCIIFFTWTDSVLLKNEFYRSQICNLFITCCVCFSCLSVTGCPFIPVCVHRTTYNRCTIRRHSINTGNNALAHSQCEYDKCMHHFVRSERAYLYNNNNNKCN